MEETKIGWTATVLADGTILPGFTHNPWIGCQRVSQGCVQCYAEAQVVGRFKLPVWGPPKTTARQRTSPENWKKPRRWNKAAKTMGVRRKVFCASLADVFEDHPMLPEWRRDLWALIEETPWLDWQLLTKRPENIARMVPLTWLDEPRPNVWYGTTVESQDVMVDRVLALAAVPAAIRFLSVEPLLGPLDLALAGVLPRDTFPGYQPVCSRLHWVIVGGESGPSARPFDLAWARVIVKECAQMQVPVYVKQLGACPVDSAKTVAIAPHGGAAFWRDAGDPEMEGWIARGGAVRPLELRGDLHGIFAGLDKAGKDMDTWPREYDGLDGLRVRQFPDEQQASLALPGLGGR